MVFLYVLEAKKRAIAVTLAMVNTIFDQVNIKSCLGKTQGGVAAATLLRLTHAQKVTF